MPGHAVDVRGNTEEMREPLDVFKAHHIFQLESELQNIPEAAPEASPSFSVSEKLARYGSSALTSVEHLTLLVLQRLRLVLSDTGNERRRNRWRVRCALRQPVDQRQKALPAHSNRLILLNCLIQQRPSQSQGPAQIRHLSPVQLFLQKICS